MRGRRTPPATISRDGLRSSRPPGRIDASARPTKSTGTNQVRPSRTGAAGSEIIRPDTEASGCCVDRTIVCVPAVTVRPPAAASSRTVRLNSRARSSSANISCPPMTRVGQRPPRVTRDDGVGSARAAGPGERSGESTARRSSPWRAREPSRWINSTAECARGGPCIRSRRDRARATAACTGPGRERRPGGRPRRPGPAGRPASTGASALQMASPRVTSRRRPARTPTSSRRCATRRPSRAKSTTSRGCRSSTPQPATTRMSRGWMRRLHAAAERPQAHRPERLQRVGQQGRAGDVERSRGVILHGRLRNSF